jgi:hypothetical protein
MRSALGTTLFCRLRIIARVLCGCTVLSVELNLAVSGQHE